MKLAGVLVRQHGRDEMVDLVSADCGVASAGCPLQDSCKLVWLEFVARKVLAVSLNPEYLIIFAEVRKARHCVFLHFE